MMNLFQTIAVVSLSVSVICVLIIVIDILSGNRQHMMIMNFVYPITALYAGPLALWVYFSIGKRSAHKKMMHGTMNTGSMPVMKKPFWQSVIIGTLHCGSGCTLGDMISETVLLFIPITFLGSSLYGSWLLDFVFAFFIGIIFQYYSIKPMKKISGSKALVAALKADTFSLIAWQVGMYGWMAISIFLIFHHRFDAGDPRFWLLMQIAMLAGFITAYPVNGWLLKKKIKEVM